MRQVKRYAIVTASKRMETAVELICAGFSSPGSFAAEARPRLFGVIGDFIDGASTPHFAFGKEGP